MKKTQAFKQMKSKKKKAEIRYNFKAREFNAKDKYKF